MENENRDNKQRKKVCSELVKLPEVQAGECSRSLVSCLKSSERIESFIKATISTYTGELK